MGGLAISMLLVAGISWPEYSRKIVHSLANPEGRRQSTYLGVGCLHAQEARLQEPYRTVTRHPGPDHSADAAMGSAPRLRHQPGDPRRLRRRAARRYRVALPGAASPGTPVLDRRGMEDLRESAASEGLSTHRRRQEATAARTLPLGATGQRHGRDFEP